MLATFRCSQVVAGENHPSVTGRRDEGRGWTHSSRHHVGSDKSARWDIGQTAHGVPKI
jgi:hypothetical protein